MLKKGGNSFHFIGWKLKHKMVSRLTQTPVVSMGLMRPLITAMVQPLPSSGRTVQGHWQDKAVMQVALLNMG